MTFAYDGDNITLVSEQLVTMIVPPSHPLEQIESAPGFSIVLRDKSGSPIYQRVSEDFRTEIEVFSKDPEKSVHRIPVNHPKGTFVVLVPDLPNARTLEFFSNPVLRAEVRAVSRPIAKFSLTLGRKSSEGGIT